VYSKQAYNQHISFGCLRIRAARETIMGSCKIYYLSTIIRFDINYYDITKNSKRTMERCGVDLPEVISAVERSSYFGFIPSLIKKSYTSICVCRRCGTAFTSHAGIKPKYVSRFITRHDIWFSVNIRCCCTGTVLCTRHAIMFYWS
jgi:hypothetical protein